ncbi:MAG: hypothetical protein EZS28_024639 [Streblomastix strix]|uniref:Uncharacterized protein n=1 Tax=Streblomastix strix TaxID=222440 RepID=A0A5J4VBA5_9EUKA|nr:MAG: hypothetical protein EZS28_024639 [Streblomastix strix]
MTHQFLLAGGGDKLISSFGGLTDLITTQLTISSGAVTGVCIISYFHGPQSSIKVSIQGDITNTFKAEIGSGTGILTTQSSSQTWPINASFSLNVSDAYDSSV